MVRFIAQNPGLASRFTTTIEFDDYTDEELLAILDSIAADCGMSDRRSAVLRCPTRRFQAQAQSFFADVSPTPALKTLCGSRSLKCASISGGTE